MNVVSYFTNENIKMIIWSIHTFWYNGSVEKKENDKFEEKAISIQKCSPDSKAIF